MDKQSATLIIKTRVTNYVVISLRHVTSTDKIRKILNLAFTYIDSHISENPDKNEIAYLSDTVKEAIKKAKHK